MKYFSLRKNTSNRQLAVALGVASACLALFALFPTEGIFQQLISSLAFLLIIPVLYIKIVLKRELRDFGWSIKEWKEGLRWSMVSIFFLALLFYVALNYLDFTKKYQLPEFAKSSFWRFLIYEAGLIGGFSFLYEFFFRGFVLSLLKEKIESVSVLVQAAVYLLFLLVVGQFGWNNAYVIVLSFFSGVIAYKSESFIFSFLTSVFTIMAFDAIIIAAIK